MKIYITVIIKSKPEFLSEIKSVLQNMTEQTRKENACVLYQLHQSTDDENIFFFYEIWENEEGLKKHNEQPYLVEFGKLAQTKLQEAPIVLKGKLTV